MSSVKNRSIVRTDTFYLLFRLFISFSSSDVQNMINCVTFFLEAQLPLVLFLWCLIKMLCYFHKCVYLAFASRSARQVVPPKSHTVGWASFAVLAENWNVSKLHSDRFFWRETTRKYLTSISVKQGYNKVFQNLTHFTFNKNTHQALQPSFFLHTAALTVVITTPMSSQETKANSF